jgi:TDG/mug DNA glycosylase family protein
MAKSITHPFEPLYDENSTTLILGSFPSILSRANDFYYGNPHNRFWPMLAELYQEKLPENNEERKALILRHQLALYDTIYSCEIKGSSDASVSHVVPADLSLIKAPIHQILLNGKLAYSLFVKYQKVPSAITIVSLPSTSPANAALSLIDLMEIYRPYLVPLLS